MGGYWPFPEVPDVGWGGRGRGGGVQAAVIISVFHPGAVSCSLKPMAPGALPKRTLQYIHLIRQQPINLTLALDASNSSDHESPRATVNSPL